MEMKMINRLCAAGALAAALLTAPVDASAQYDSSQLVGYWECAANIDGLDGVNRIEIGPSGDARQFLKIEGAVPNGPRLEVFASSVGTWRIENGNIVEEVAEDTLHLISIDGQLLPPSSFQEEFMGDGPGTAVLPIVELNGGRLVYQDLGSNVVCQKL